MNDTDFRRCGVLETDMDNGLHMLVGSVGVLTPRNP